MLFSCTPYELVAFTEEKLSFSGSKGLLLSELWQHIQDKLHQTNYLDDFQKQTIWKWLLFDVRAYDDHEEVKYYVTYDKDPITIESDYQSFINKQKKPLDLRIRATDDTQCFHLTGQSNYKRCIQTLGVFPYQLLVEIAKYGDKGAWSVEVSDATGQDKRSMTGRLNKLEESGLIVKEQRYWKEKKIHTSWVVHYKLTSRAGADKPPQSHEDEMDKTPDKIRQFIVNALKDATNHIRTFRDLKVEMKMHLVQHMSRLFEGVVDTLVESGCVERIDVPHHHYPERMVYALRYLKDLPLGDDAIFDNDSLISRLREKKSLIDKGKEMFEDDFKMEEKEEKKEEDYRDMVIDDEDNDGHKDHFPSATFNDIYTLATQVYQTIEDAGSTGTTSRQLIQAIMGEGKHRGVAKILESFPTFLVIDDVLIPQQEYPGEDPHHAIVRQSETDGRTKYYRYYTKQNFNSARVKGSHKKSRPTAQLEHASLLDLEIQHRTRLEKTPSGDLVEIPCSILTKRPLNNAEVEEEEEEGGGKREEREQDSVIVELLKNNEPTVLGNICGTPAAGPKRGRPRKTPKKEEILHKDDQDKVKIENESENENENEKERERERERKKVRDKKVGEEGDHYDGDEVQIRKKAKTTKAKEVKRQRKEHTEKEPKELARTAKPEIESSKDTNGNKLNLTNTSDVDIHATEPMVSKRLTRGMARKENETHVVEARKEQDGKTGKRKLSNDSDNKDDVLTTKIKRRPNILDFFKSVSPEKSKQKLEYDEALATENNSVDGVQNKRNIEENENKQHMEQMQVQEHEQGHEQGEMDLQSPTNKAPASQENVEATENESNVIQKEKSISVKMEPNENHSNSMNLNKPQSQTFTPTLKQPIVKARLRKVLEKSMQRSADVTGSSRRKVLLEVIKNLGGVTFARAKLAKLLDERMGSDTTTDLKTIVRDIHKLVESGDLEVQLVQVKENGQDMTRRLMILTDPKERPSDEMIEKVKTNSSVWGRSGYMASQKTRKLIGETYDVVNPQEALGRRLPRLSSLKSKEPRTVRLVGDGEKQYPARPPKEKTLNRKARNEKNSRSRRKERKKVITMSIDFPIQFDRNDVTQIFRAVCICKSFKKNVIDFEAIAALFLNADADTIKRLWNQVRRQLGGMSSVKKGEEAFEQIVLQKIEENYIGVDDLNDIQLPFFLNLWDSSDPSKIYMSERYPLYNSIEDNLSYYNKLNPEQTQDLFDNLELPSMKLKEEALVSKSFDYNDLDTTIVVEPKSAQIRTAIKALFITRPSQQSKVDIDRILKDFDELELEQVSVAMNQEGDLLFQNENPTTKFLITEKVFEPIQDCVSKSFFKTANQFRENLLEITSSKKGLVITQGLEDSNAAQLLSLLSSNMVSMTHIDHPYKFEGYESRAVDKDCLECDMLVYKDLGSNAAQEPSIKNVPVPVGKPCSYVWVDSHGQINSELWRNIIAALVYFIHSRPGIPSIFLYKKYQRLLSYKELNVVLDWLKKSQFIVHGPFDGYSTTSNWLSILGS